LSPPDIAIDLDDDQPAGKKDENGLITFGLRNKPVVSVANQWPGLQLLEEYKSGRLVARPNESAELVHLRRCKCPSR